MKNLKESALALDDRMDWHNYFSSLCILVSTRSSCNRLHVGCVIVKDNRVISCGYNGFLKGLPHKSIVVNNHEQGTVHAEQNAITDAASRGVALNGSTAYVTHYPCIHCTKLLIATGIKKIYYLDDYKNSEIATDLFKQAGIPVIKLT